jgi:hypothetical protein
MADYTGHLYQHPRVELFTDEARSFLRRSDQRWQVIYYPHTISNAAMSSGSLSLSENYLLTVEAFRDAASRLAPDGVIVMTRPEAQMPRLFTTLRASLEPSLGSLAPRLLAWRQRGAHGPSFYAGVAVRAQPFTADEIDRFARVLAAHGLEPLYLPSDSRSLAPYPALLTAADPYSVVLETPALLEPATDDKPFFNRRVALSSLSLADLTSVFSRGAGARFALEDRPVAEAALLALLLQTAVLAILFILAPLFLLRKRNVDGRGRARTLAAFGALGLGYIVIEVGLIQRFTLFLGSPVIVFSTVLATLLTASGAGAGFARRYRSSNAPFRACLAAAAAALATWLIGPRVVAIGLAWPTGMRVVAAVLMLAPAGFVMGMPFPLLVRRLEATHPERISWAWGVNGFASVVGSIAAVVLGMTAGYSAVLAAGFACYLAAAVAARDPLSAR